MPFSRFRPQLPTFLTVALLLPALGAGAQELEVLPEYETEMAAITADPRVAAALDDVLAMDEENERLLIELTEIEAPPFKEEKTGGPLPGTRAGSRARRRTG